MDKKKITSKEKVEALKKSSKSALEEKSKATIQNMEWGRSTKKEEKEKRKRSKPLRSELKKIGEQSKKNFIFLSTSFTKMDLILQICIIIPILLILLLICNQIFLHSS